MLGKAVQISYQQFSYQQKPYFGKLLVGPRNSVCQQRFPRASSHSKSRKLNCIRESDEAFIGPYSPMLVQWASGKVLALLLRDDCELNTLQTPLTVLSMLAWPLMCRSLIYVLLPVNFGHNAHSARSDILKKAGANPIPYYLVLL